MNLKAEALENTNSLAAQYFIGQNINVEQFIPSPFGMLDFSPVGIAIALFGVFFITLIGWRLIPKESYKNPSSGSHFSIDEYITEIRIPKDCKLIDLKIKDISYIENGSLYIFTYKHFVKNNNRLGGKIGYTIFPEEYSGEIDSNLDFIVMEEISKQLNLKNKK